MSREYITAEQRGRVGIVTFNRPDRLNAMIPEMGAEVRAQLEEWEKDNSVGAIVLTGAGQGLLLGGGYLQFREAAFVTGRQLGRRKGPVVPDTSGDFQANHRRH